MRTATGDPRSSSSDWEDKNKNRHQDRNVECSDHATEGEVGKHQQRDGKKRDKYFGIERSEMEGSWENTI